MLKNIIKNDKYVLAFASLHIPLNVINQFINIYLTAAIVGLISKGNEGRLVLAIILFAACKFTTSTLLQYSSTQLATRNYKSRMKFVSNYASKYMKADFGVIESVEGRDMAQRAKNTMFDFDFLTKPTVESFPLVLTALLSNLLGIFVYSGIISLLNPLILLVLICTSSLSYIFQKFLVKHDQEDKKRYIPI